MKRSTRRKRPSILGGSIAKMEAQLKAHGRLLRSFKKGDTVRGAGGMAIRKGYTYVLNAAPGDIDRSTGFDPDLSPGEMLMLGVFEGKYLNDCIREFPAEWFVGGIVFGTLSPGGADPLRCNLFGVKSRQPLWTWQENGWVPSGTPLGSSGSKGSKGRDILADPLLNPDERGWFQWYCRYWMGRRLPDLDHVQIGRWRSFRRHAGAVRAGCSRGTLSCRPRERQALLQWAYNPFI